MQQRTNSMIFIHSACLVGWRCGGCGACAFLPAFFPAITTHCCLPLFVCLRPCPCSSLLTAFEQEALLDSSYFFCKQDSVVAAAQLLGQVRGLVSRAQRGRSGQDGAGPQLAHTCRQGNPKLLQINPCSIITDTDTRSIFLFFSPPAAAAVCERYVQLLHGPRQRHRPSPGRRAAPVRHQVQVRGPRHKQIKRPFRGTESGSRAGGKLTIWARSVALL